MRMAQHRNVQHILPNFSLFPWERGHDGDLWQATPAESRDPSSSSAAGSRQALPQTVRAARTRPMISKPALW